MARVIWKGAISFGLVHVPVALHTAARETGIDFDWLDKRTMDAVGYKRVNKRTGREVPKEAIVKGVKQDDGDYVIVSEDEIKEAFPRTTQTVSIESFVAATEIPFFMLEKPYYLSPLAKGERVYVLLREAMLEAGVIGIGRVVMHAKEHLAALVPTPTALMLNTIRWGNEIVEPDDIDLPSAGKSASHLKPAELKMARQLIKEMTDKWDPNAYTDAFTDSIHQLIRKKVAAGKTQTVKPFEEVPKEGKESNVVDLTELLKRSLGGRASAKTTKKPAAKKTAAATKATRKAPASAKAAANKPRKAA